MTRRVITKRLDEVGGQEVDGYFDKVVKYIPADVVAAWVAVSGMVKSATGVNKSLVMWIVFAAGLALTAAWTWKQTSVTGHSLASKQIFISSLAFVVWVVALGPPFDSIGLYHPLYGSLLLIGYTLVMGFFDQ